MDVHPPQNGIATGYATHGHLLISLEVTPVSHPKKASGSMAQLSFGFALLRIQLCRRIGLYKVVVQSSCLDNRKGPQCVVAQLLV